MLTDSGIRCGNARELSAPDPGKGTCLSAYRPPDKVVSHLRNLSYKYTSSRQELPSNLTIITRFIFIG